ncbi:AzlC family ABC transporter permease [Cryptosporangium aurantiacum]|uniref:Predicted branched-chain amino acid permease (Azaleucine resistance) n=1 Tax=Cryptosporangium aurantiacum TaxID=134849 RepID=A0A1M7NJJ0_9ACTN|nr:AzlC family ABC transporter permease [Cryptosporangium aurantiacum]SHN04091.1 Predicted branched-chain amino acid permease (azaleucine resistance) [Cryptosporangium aurantiacum]
MRSLYRTLGPELTRSIVLVCLADALVGASYGAIAVSSGFPLWLPILLSVLVFAGAAQFLFLGLIAGGGNPLAAVAAGLLVNARHLPFGLAVAQVFDRRRPANHRPTVGGGAPPDSRESRNWLRQLLGSHLMTDETVAFALAQDDPDRRRAAYWASGVALFVSWNISVVLGGMAGSVIGDTDALGLDAAFPAVLLALVLPSLTDAATRWAALIGVVVALGTTPFLPAGAPVLLALVGVAVVAPFTVLRRQASAADARAAGGEGRSA